MELAKLLSTADLADRVGVEPNTVEKWRHRGTGPRFIRLGGRANGRVVYDPKDVEAWLEASKVGSTSDQRAA